MANSNKKTLIAPSILSADFSKMGEEVARMEQSGADLIHVDVMDGVFVPNITFGIKMVGDIRPHTKLALDTHLMIVNPEKYVAKFVAAGSDIVTVHFEACGDKLLHTLKAIKECGAKCGVAINPETPAQTAEEFIEYADLVCLMSVHPGFGGQSFIEGTLDKIRYVKDLVRRYNLNVLIETDGGVTRENAGDIAQSGADILVAGSAVFNVENAKAAIADLKGR